MRRYGRRGHSGSISEVANLKKIRSGVTAISFRAFWPKNETTRRVLVVDSRRNLKQQQINVLVVA